jgi:GT2 family glycosyltransferase
VGRATACCGIGTRCKRQHADFYRAKALSVATLSHAPSQRVGIIVPTFNRAELLRPCLESLLAQTVSAAQVLVVDDGSSDHTAEVVASFGDRVTYLHKPNAGKASAVNLALQHMEADWVWLFDDDDIALPRAIESRLAALARQPKALWVYGPHLVGQDRGDGTIVETHQQAMQHPGDTSVLLGLLKACYFHLNSGLVHRSLYERAGPFDTDFVAGQDYDMQIRLAASTPEVAFSEEPAFVFRHHRGPRGEQSVRYAVSRREMMQIRFSQRLGEKVRSSMTMDAFLAPRRAILQPADEIDALLGRAAAMGNLGCWGHMLNDLGEAGRLAGSAGAWPSDGLARVRGFFGNGWLLSTSFDDWTSFVSTAARLELNPRGAQIKRALAVGLWQVARGFSAPVSERFRRAQRAWELHRARPAD